tara:strand:+ start:3883 stop:4650 length:768 start_codon:yes stop_codon:yes gene_type:complete
MELKNLMAGEAIAAVYAGVPSVMWDFASADNQAVSAEHQQTRDVLNATLRKYCPLCKQANTLRAVDPSAANDHARYKCRSCLAFCRRPMALLARGPRVKSSHVPRENASSRIARAMEASRVMNAVEALPAHLRLWALWVYTDPAPAEQHNLEGLLLAVMLDYLDGVEKENIKGVKTGADAVRIVSMQMNSFRQERRRAKKLFKASDYARAINRDRKQFDAQRLWGRFCAAAVDCMNELDSAALTPVDDVLRTIRR